MKRRKFLKISAISAGATLIGGGAFHIMFKDSDPLSAFYDATRKVYKKQFGDNLSATLFNETKQAYENILLEIPYIGGKENIFSEWLNYGAYYLGVYQALSAHGYPIDEIGKIIFDTYETMADYPKWFLHIVGSLKYGRKYEDKLRQAAAVSQQQKYPEDFVSYFVEGTDEEFDYGLDITECCQIDRHLVSRHIQSIGRVCDRRCAKHTGRTDSNFVLCRALSPIRSERQSGPNRGCVVVNHRINHCYASQIPRDGPSSSKAISFQFSALWRSN